ncbi:MAG TPA: hypothetical protein VHX17_13220 [Candidatus Cybelea sp.]|jgi:hypothetical protein|nr:hypothetical protein [Candidatus Cybelea sp.]
MKATGFVRCAGAAVALAIVSACSGGPAVAPSTAGFNATYVGRTLFVNGRPVTAAHLRPAPRFASLVPDHHTRSKFEYVFSYYETYASIFNYPKSDRQIGQINGDGGQGCTNVLYGYGHKTFWNVGGPTQITEYKVPQTPIKTLTTGYVFPSSCAMNSSGDLAVGILYGTSYGRGGQIVLYKNGSGSGTVYTTPLDEEFFNGYDNKGDLFADGFTGDRSGFALVELPKGSSKFVTITTSNVISFPGSVQWDGTYLTVLDQDSNAISRYTISGTKATLKDTVTLTAGDCAQTWIVKNHVYCGDAGNDDGEVYNYPGGGAPVAVFAGYFDLPLGVVAAEK